jgi:hypothetical protein
MVATTELQDCNRCARGGGSHPPIMTSASIISDASTSMVSKEASLIVPSASYPTRECKRFEQRTAPALMRAALPDLSGSSSSGRPIPQAS